MAGVRLTRSTQTVPLIWLSSFWLGGRATLTISKRVSALVLNSRPAGRTHGVFGRYEQLAHVEGIEHLEPWSAVRGNPFHL